MFREASNFYLTALRKNPNNIDARIAIKKNGQKVLEEMLSNFYQSYSASDHKKAVYDYLKAKSFHEEVQPYADINFAPYYKEYFEESRDIYLEERYNEALALKEERKYEEANEVFSEILKIQPDYEDVSKLERVSRLEPVYLRGREAMANDQFRDAYRYFEEVLRSGPYKDAAQLKNEALEKAAFTIAILPSSYVSQNEQEVAEKFNSMVVEELLKLNNPFIKLIDRSNIDKILEEQKLALSGVVDSKTSAEAGKILGAKAVLSANIISYKANLKAPQAVQKKGYEAITVRKYNKATDTYFTETQFKKVQYQEVFGSNNVSANIRFSLSSSETAQILVSDLISGQESDQILYGIYEGDFRNLYAGTWRSLRFNHAEDKVFNDANSKRALNQKFTTKKRALKSTDALKVEMLEKMAKEVARKIEAYDNSL